MPRLVCVMIRRLHDGMKAFARVNGDNASNSLRHGCVFSRMLFDIFSCAMVD